MSIPAKNMSYHDLSSLQQIRGNAAKDKEGALRQAAEQFESIFFNMLLSSMRKANEAFEVEGMMNSQSSKFYRDMQDSQMATELSQSGALGLADLLVKQLGPAMGITPADDKKALAMPGAESERALKMPKVILPAQHIVPRQVSVMDGQPADAKATAADTLKAAAVQTTQAQKEYDHWQVASPEEFVRNLLPAARQSAKALGLDPLALIAQAALETGWGQRMIKTAAGSNSFNLFGIKANNGWQGDTAVVDTLEYRGGIAKKEQAKFRSYSSPEQSLHDYVAFIKHNPRYQDAVNASSDTKAYFEQLQAAGYATDPAYAKKIMAVYQSPALQNARDAMTDTKDSAAAAD